MEASKVEISLICLSVAQSICCLLIIHILLTDGTCRKLKKPAAGLRQALLYFSVMNYKRMMLLPTTLCVVSSATNIRL